MQEGQESGTEFLDPRLLSWEQRYALRRRAIELAHDERSRFLAGLVRRLWSRTPRTPGRAAGEVRPGRPAAAPCGV